MYMFCVEFSRSAWESSHCAAKLEFGHQYSNTTTFDITEKYNLYIYILLEAQSPSQITSPKRMFFAGHRNAVVTSVLRAQRRFFVPNNTLKNNSTWGGFGTTVSCHMKSFHILWCFMFNESSLAVNAMLCASWKVDFKVSLQASYEGITGGRLQAYVQLLNRHEPFMYTGISLHYFLFWFWLHKTLTWDQSSFQTSLS